MDLAISLWRGRFTSEGAGRGFCLLIALAFLLSRPAQAGIAGRIEITGAIGPPTMEYIQRAIRVATEQKMVCLMVQLDTPGGLLDSTKQIVQAFYASPVPVVVYVAPAGSTATSAGCIITLAADVAAMAPGTSIGAAHPVSLGGGSDENTDPVMKAKVENYASAFIESIAAHRHRNTEWAKASVKESVAITAEKALELKVIDLIAPDMPGLLRQLEGRSVNGTALRTAGAEVHEIPMLVQEKFFHTLWRPEVMFILMLIAIYGIIGELSNPGVILPGVIGAIALILALYMSSVLPVNMAAAALVGLAVVLFVVDVYAPTHGVLTFGGIIAFFLGSLMLFNTGESGYRLPLPWIISATVITAGFFLGIVGAGLRAQRRLIRVGKETMVGRAATALTPIDARSGKVMVDGEYWNAISGAAVPKGGTVIITGFRGLTLITQPQTQQ